AIEALIELLEANGQEPCHPTGPFTWIGMELGNLLVGYCNQKEYPYPDPSHIPTPYCWPTVEECIQTFTKDSINCELLHPDAASQERKDCEAEADRMLMICMSIAE
ncbi:MAG TPA: hypothetical protein VFJ58_10745, partial [Armatimonadota bacterium]|nr:hypothetical protein [Armatimonadota bacterium]